MSMDTAVAEKAQHVTTAQTTENDSSVMDDDIPITYVEFFAGIGGWTMAFHEALKRCSLTRRLQRLAALDHSDLSTKVLQHNSHADANDRKRKRSPVSIERLTVDQLHDWHAMVWAMSPPCQPHTRQHANQEKELDDPRSQSFLHLCSLLEKMEESKLPRLVLLENVVGFESSGSCQRWREVLSKRNYVVGHFHLTPTQVGIPNDRPRYFCVAVLTTCIVPGHSLSKYAHAEADLQVPPNVQSVIPELDVAPENDIASSLPRISEFLDASGTDSPLRIPDKVLESRAAWCFDIVTAEDRRSACFTQSYGKFIRGTGSVLWQPKRVDHNAYGDVRSRFQLVPPQEREFNPSWSDGLNLKETTRYFSGQEVAKLMGFDKSFSFPADCTLRQQWKLLGNSLNVRVAARVTELGLRLVLLS